MAPEENGAATLRGIDRGERFRMWRRPATAGALFATLDVLGPAEGVNAGNAWKGLTVHRYCQPMQLPSAEFGPLSVGFVAQTQDSAAAIGGRQLRDRAAYIITAGRSSLDFEITAASTHHPVLYCALQLDPKLVTSTSSKMYPLSVAGPASRTCAGPVPSTLDDELTHTATAFLESLSHSCDRRVLAPILMQELVFRLLRREQRTRLMYLAADELKREPVAAALSHIADHLADPLPVEALAMHVSLSSSAFSRLFREATGLPPHRYIKDCRLDRAKELLDDRKLGVSSVAAAVGYSSVSHFIKEFRGRFGHTPGQYATQAVRGEPSLNAAIQ
ncbi:helix-turn-helix domain-containing protein [Mycobacterium sp. C31M]